MVAAVVSAASLLFGLAMFVVGILERGGIL